MQTDWNFPKRVARSEDGAYYWNYDMKANGNHDPLWVMVGISSAIALPIALIMLFMTWRYNPTWAALSSLAVVVMMVLLPAGIWLLLPPNPSFRMSETEIETWPKGKGVNVHPFASARSVEMHPQVDMIRLRFAFGALRVYVPREDYALVREFIAAHVPEGTPIYY